MRRNRVPSQSSVAEWAPTHQDEQAMEWRPQPGPLKKESLPPPRRWKRASFKNVAFRNGFPVLHDLFKYG
jgi:hypothetical protein